MKYLLINPFQHRFPKPKDEGWFLVLGNIETRELLALKRIGVLRGNVTNQQITFTTPSTKGPQVSDHQLEGFQKNKRVILTLYVISDAYIGLDQQYDLKLEVT